MKRGRFTRAGAVYGVDLQSRYAGCVLETVPPRAMSRTRAPRWKVHAMIRNVCRYLGMTESAFYRRVFREFGEHYLHMLDGGDGDFSWADADDIERRLGFVFLRFTEGKRDNDTYRACVDSITDKYDLPPWRIWIGSADDERAIRAKDPVCEAGEIVLLVDPGEFR